MRVLYITGNCLTKNTSANMSHNAFVRGLLDCGAELEIIMANDSWGEEDKALPRFENAKYIEYNSKSTADKILDLLHKMNKSGKHKRQDIVTAVSSDKAKGTPGIHVRNLAKRAFYTVFPEDPVYPISKKWILNASRFRSDIPYDLVISNSSPAASHRLAAELIRSGHVSCDRWIQIWEDPWFCDLYGRQGERIKEEEHRLLRLAKEIYYVSPLTVMYQKRLYPDCATSMKCIPLPYLELPNPVRSENVEGDAFGYFGDYYSVSRNIQPFYTALQETGYRGCVYGDSDLCLESNERIDVHGRVTLDVLTTVQNRVQVLVHLSNLKGGQIPGKVYHYSASDKPILFILDGTDEEKKLLRVYFGQFERFVFCDNTVESIKEAMYRIMNGQKHFSPVADFSPHKVVEMIIHEESKEIV